MVRFDFIVDEDLNVYLMEVSGVNTLFIEQTVTHPSIFFQTGQHESQPVFAAFQAKPAALRASHLQSDQSDRSQPAGDAAELERFQQHRFLRLSGVRQGSVGQF